MMAGNILQVVASLLMFSSKWIQRYEVIIVGRLIMGFYGGIYIFLLYAEHIILSVCLSLYFYIIIVILIHTFCLNI